MRSRPRAVLTERARAEICRQVGQDGRLGRPGRPRVRGGLAHGDGRGPRPRPAQGRSPVPAGRTRRDRAWTRPFLAATADASDPVGDRVRGPGRGPAPRCGREPHAAAVRAGWRLKPAPWRAGIDHAVTSTPTRATPAAPRALPDADLVVDHFHAVRLANAALDEVRRRVQHATLGHRGRKHDPLYRIRRRLLAAHERLSTAAGCARLSSPASTAVTPKAKSAPPTSPRSCCARLHATTSLREARRRLAGSTALRGRRRRRARAARPHHRPLGDRDPRLASHRGLSNGATEAMNLLIKKIKRVGHGFRNFDNYRLRLLLHCGVTWQAAPAARIRGRQPRLVRVEPVVGRRPRSSPCRSAGGLRARASQCWRAAKRKVLRIRCSTHVCTTAAAR